MFKVGDIININHKSYDESERVVMITKIDIKRKFVRIKALQSKYEDELFYSEDIQHSKDFWNKCVTKISKV